MTLGRQEASGDWSSGGGRRGSRGLGGAWTAISGQAAVEMMGLSALRPAGGIGDHSCSSAPMGGEVKDDPYMEFVWHPTTCGAISSCTETEEEYEEEDGL
ncbi:hypothetical protein U9M48_014460, partial [Paspalum notatum var. saurae]